MQIDNTEEKLQSDVASIQKIPIIKTLLDVICRTTNMRFAAVARVTEDRWISCSLLDNMELGLKPGDELEVETTICHEVRQRNQAVVIDDVKEDDVFCHQKKLLRYGFKSYISTPIIRRDGSFFGTLCAIDYAPAKLNNPKVTGLFNLFSDLISFHLNAVEQIESSETKLLEEREEQAKALEQKNVELQKMNQELESFAYVASHDLQEPLRKIETFSNFILEKDYNNLTQGGKHYFDRLLKSVKRMQTLIKDLIRYTQVKVNEQIFEDIPLISVIEEVQQDFSEELQKVNGSIVVSAMCNAFVIPFQFNQLLQNIIGNAIKFSKPGVDLVIDISGTHEKGNSAIHYKLLNDKNYCHLTISDNGIGFELQHNERIFEVFQRLHGREEYEGTGIGLSIVKKIVENHHGIIMAKGEPDKGARFDIYIPQP